LNHSIIRSALFRFEPETIHALTFYLLRFTGALRPLNWIISQIYRSPSRPVQAFGLTFRNPVGLAAGYDKDGLGIRGLAALGFGHIEIGTVTPLPQPGNPKPRVFRLVEDEALINRMGFPSRGSEFVQSRLNSGLSSGWVERFVGISRRKPLVTRRSFPTILGVNLGRNKTTSNEQAVFDYLALIQNFAPLADYLTINVSSPNTEGLRKLQGREALESLLTPLHQQRMIEQEQLKRRVPLLVKLSPDLSDQELDDALDIILRTHMDGIIATNTTLLRRGLRSSLQSEAGGLSGGGLRQQSEGMLHKIVQRIHGEIPIVSTGGILSPDDVKRRLGMGATLVQIYTGLIYRGPGIVRSTVRLL
jgi:dihydroorotate dehydrogenase